MKPQLYGYLHIGAKVDNKILGVDVKFVNRAERCTVRDLMNNGERKTYSTAIQEARQSTKYFVEGNVTSAHTFQYVDLHHVLLLQLYNYDNETKPSTRI